MKTRLYLFLCILIAVASCKDEVPFEPELTVLSSSVQMYESDGGEKFLSIRSNVEWTAITTADWISISPLSGDGSAASTKISIRENESYDFREGKIIFRNNEYNLADTVTIEQAQKDAIILAQDSCKVSCDGCELKFTVSSNVNYDIQTPSWIKHLKSRGLTDKDIFFEVEVNNKRENRSGTITFKSGDLVQEVVVVQYGYDDSAEREILIAFYQATDGDNWKNNENWCSDKLLSEWYGVTLDKNNKVSSLNLNNNQLSGSIPPELGNLSNLTDLDLGNNQLSGSIPPELENLSNLTSLNLNKNQLSGSIPSELGNLTNLTELNLSYNQLSGSIPPELGNLSELRELNLKNDRNNLGEGLGQLSGSIPPELGNLSNLTSLNLEYNQLSGSIPSELGNLSNLKTLDLYDNQLSGSIPPELGNLSKLTSLNLEINQLSGSIPSELGNLSKLTSLDLYYNQLSGSIPPELGNLSKLTNLNLGYNQLSGSIPPELGKLSNLRSLYLQNNQLSGSIPSELANPSNLKYLYLYGNQLDGDIPAFIFELYKDLDGVDIIRRLLEKNVYNSVRNNFNNISNFTLSAPEFTVKDLNGNIIKSDELYERNKVTILYWWDYLCGAAITCTKTLIGLQQMYGSEGLEILGIYDGITEQEIVDYLAKNNIPWNNIFYSSDNYVKGSTGGVPVVMVIDNNKHIIFSDYIYNRDELPAFLYEYFQE